METIMKEIGLDRYDRNARLKPAFLTLLPAFVLLAIWVPDVWHKLAAIGSLAVACGLTFFMSRVARYYGRGVEKDLLAKHGGVQTTLILRHRDGSLANETKLRYHAFLRKKGFDMPSPEQETADPSAADDRYRAAVDWLREQTRDDRRFGMVKTELIDYGFRRNLLGMKPIALTILAACFCANSIMLWRNGTNDAQFWTGLVLEAVLAGGIAMWIWVVRLGFVEDAARSYAIRLLAQCERLQSGSRAKK